MRSLVLIALVACGGKQQPPVEHHDPVPAGPVKDTRTPIEVRRDTACGAVGDRLVTCAVKDAKAELDAGKVSKKDFDANTAPEIQRALKKKWLDVCRTPKTTHQVRVLEVCLKEEGECGPFADCLGHLNDELTK